MKLKNFGRFLLAVLFLIASFSCYTDEYKGTAKTELTAEINDLDIQNAVKFLKSQPLPEEKDWVDALVLREAKEFLPKEFSWGALVVLREGSLKFLHSAVCCDLELDALIDVGCYLRFYNRDRDFTVREDEVHILKRNVDFRQKENK